MEGHSYLDNTAAEVPFEDTPWYGVAYESPEQDPVGVGNQLPATILEEDDTPVLAGTNHMWLTVPGPNGLGAPLTDYVDRFWMTIDFGLFFAVRTREDSLSSQKVYTQRASAYWTFDGTGTINQGDPNNNFAGKGDWQAIENRTGNYMMCPGCDPAFEEVNDGSVVPITVGPTANEVSNNPNLAYWFTRLNPNQ